MTSLAAADAFPETCRCRSRYFQNSGKEDYGDSLSLQEALYIFSHTYAGTKDRAAELQIACRIGRMGLHQKVFAG